MLIILMARPKKHRKIDCNPYAYYYKPRGIPLDKLQKIGIDKDEIEAMRLADYLCLKHEEAAEKMQISRATFGRIVNSARRKIIDSILHGKAIEINK
jgi:predicted DNA-binding protein (UPF0251 family)